jgi:AraC-like DNA-binding protein
MERTIDGPFFTTAQPCAPLRAYVSHYWLSLCNPRLALPVLPDGTVDVVIHRHGPIVGVRAYGAITAATTIAVEPQSHYLGIRFRPGQSRHFMRACAQELTDACEPAEGLLAFGLDGLAEAMLAPDVPGVPNVFSRLDALLERHLAARPPRSGRIDAAIAVIEAAHGAVRMDAPAAACGTGPRQFERIFRQTVGVSPKLFASIVRFAHAAELIGRRQPLADVALAAGYVDQSHMGRDVRRLTGLSARRLQEAMSHFYQTGLR